MSVGNVQKIQFVDSLRGPIAKWGEDTVAVLSAKDQAKIGHILIRRGPVRCRMISREGNQILVTPTCKTWGSLGHLVSKPTKDLSFRQLEALASPDSTIRLGTVVDLFQIL